MKIEELPVYSAKKVDSDEYVTGTGFYRGVLTDEPMTVGDCRIVNIIIENGTMWHIDLSTLSIKFPDKVNL